MMLESPPLLSGVLVVMAYRCDRLVCRVGVSEYIATLCAHVRIYIIRYMARMMLRLVLKCLAHWYKYINKCTCIVKLCYLCGRICTIKCKSMKKLVISLAAAMAATSAFAGGLLTTTSQNAHYLRFFTQDANITLTSLYANPAGQAFLSNGWHMGISSMSAMQSRTIDTTTPLFKFNANNPNSMHQYKGDAFAPVVPAIDVTYNQDKWSISAHLGLVGGGGACEFENGLGSLETIAASSIYSVVFPALVGNIMSNGVPEDQARAMAGQLFRYDLNSYMKGKQYYFGLQVGGTYKILDNLAVYAGVRGVYATCNYNGYIQDMEYSVDGGQTFLPAHDPSVPFGNQNLSMNCEQVGFGVTPILGIHYRPNKHWELAAKYEFKTRIRLKNTSDMNKYTNFLATNPSSPAYPILSQFADGRKVAEDMPGLLTIGVQYSPIQDLRIAAAYHLFQDKSATKFADKHTSKYIDSNTMEYLAGVEWKFCKWVTASCSWQMTNYGLTDAYMNDVSFNLSSNSMGLGVRIHPTKLFNIDLGYMHTFYKDREVKTQIAGLGTKSDLYSRTNDVVGIGFNFAW